MTKLSHVPVGTAATITTLQGSGHARLRLLDLGFVPGQQICPVQAAPGGDPVAYRVRGTIIALRQQDAATIDVVPEVTP